MDPRGFRPPVLVGERVVWLGSGSGIPQGGVVRWIGKLPEMGRDWTVGMELDNQLPYGGIDGAWGNRQLFSCKPKHGLIVPITTTLREHDLFQRSRQQPGSSLRHGSATSSGGIDSELPARPRRSDQARQLKSAKQTGQLKQVQQQTQSQHPELPKQIQLAELPKQIQLPKQTEQAQLPTEQPIHAQLPELPKQAQLVESPKESNVPEQLKQINHPEQLKETESHEQLKDTESHEQLKKTDCHEQPAETESYEQLTETESREQLKETVCHEQPAETESPEQLKRIELIEQLRQLEFLAHLHQQTYEYPVATHQVRSAGERLTSNPLPALRRKRKSYPQRPTRLKASRGNYQVNGSDCVTLPCPTIKEECELLTPSRCDTLPSVASNRGDTLKSNASGDYKWYDAVDKTGASLDDNSVYEPVQVTSDDAKQCCDEAVTEEHDREQSEIMNSLGNLDSSYEETVAVADEIYADKCKTNSYQRSTTSSCQSQTGSGSRKEKVNSGFFSFLRWFRKGKDDEDDVVKNGEFVEGGVTPTVPSSPQLNHSHNSSCGSIDSLFSTATVSSFSFVQPTYYRPYGSAIPPEKCIAVGLDTDTYRNRLRYRDRARELDRNLTLKKKYRLYASDSLSAINTPEASPQLKPRRVELVNSEPVVKEQNKINPPPSPGSQNSTFGKKKRRAPAPPNLPKAQYSDYSLPSTLENKSKVKSVNGNNGSTVSLNKSYHRRTASESSKDKKAGAYCHVKGKRKAPSPPQTGNEQGTSNGGTLEKVRSASSSFGRKKRPAPLPPHLNGKEEFPRRKVNKESQVEQLQRTGNKTTLSNLSPAERDKLIANIAKLQAHADRRSMSSPPASPHLAFRASHVEQVVCNDTLKIERGVLKSNKEMPKNDPPVTEVKVAPCSPRPWYKRSLVKTDSNSSIGGGGLLKRDIFKSLEKKKDRDKDRDREENWMPEVGIARSSIVISESSSTSSSKFNIFSRLDKSEEKKKEAEKRKSQVSMLANISELDREAAEIVQKTQARENAIMEAHDAKFYSYPDVAGDGSPRVEDVDEVDGPGATKRSSARELISLFNAIGNVTRVTVNTSFFSKDGASFFSREGMEKRFSFMGESSKSSDGHSAGSNGKTNDGSMSPTVNSPAVERRVDGLYPGITIEEMDDDADKASKARILYEANKSRRHRSPSPSFPTIAEQSESASSVATTPLSTQSRVGHELPPAVDAGNQVWVCPRCTLENPRWKITCDVCNRWRPSSGYDRNSMTEDAVERPASPVPFMDQDKSDAREDNKSESNGKPKIMNWEDELRRYFPDSPKIARGKTETRTETKVNHVEVRKENITKTATNISSVGLSSSTPGELRKTPVQSQQSTEDCAKNEVILPVRKSAIDSPSTFIGGRLKQDEDKVIKPPVNKIAVNEQTVYKQAVNKQPINNGVVGSELPTIEETDVDELRKARLAFFNRASDRCIDFNEEGHPVKADADAGKKVIDENERSKLREMLKEMKNSLPKRPKVNRSQAPCDDNRKSINLDQHDIYKQIETSAVSFPRNSVIKDEASKHGAIKKVPPIAKETPQEVTPIQNNVQDSTPPKLNGKCEALFITKTTVYENIKMKKTDLTKPQKVSTSVQTSGVVRKVDASDQKPPTGRPATAEDSSVGIKDGVLYTSLHKDSRRIGRGTFELIRATDFKNIKATKTDESAPVHVYANMPTSPDLSKRVLPQQPSAPTLEEVFNVPSDGKLDDDLPLSLPGSSDQWSSATESPVPRFPDSPVPQSPESRSARGGSKRSTGSDVSGYSAASCRSSDTSEVERLTEELTKPKGLADFKAHLQASPGEQNNMNTLAVNRLLRRLEAAIAGGQHIQAAGLARDLARQKISCSVTRQRRSLDCSPAAIMVDMYVEDKVSHQGPIPLQVMPTMTVAQLKLKVEQEFEIPAGVQRWILGKLLASDDAKTLEDHNVNASGCPMFLYLVVPDGDQESDAGSAPGSLVEQEVAEEEVAGPPRQAPHGKGWYYNYEEDHYSHCEDSDEDLSDADVEALRAASPVHETRPPPAKVAPAVVDVEEEEEDEDEDEEEEEEATGVHGNVVLVKEPPVVIQDVPPIPRLPESYSPVAGSSRAAAVRAAPPVKVVEVAAKSAPVKVENKTGTLKLGWKCPVCTLVNAPTRPGCAACTTERPAQYVVPTDYKANQQEQKRLQREQQLDNDMQQATAEEKRQEVADQHQHYLQLVTLDKADLVPNSEPFDCSVCLAAYGPGEGTVLRECLHIFCRPCLVNTVQFSEEAEVKCPYRDANYACDSVLQEREIKALVPKNVYEQHLAKSVAQAENKIGNAFHCKTPDCRGWCIFEDNLNEFRCPVCVKTNCLTCQAIHDGINCKQYQERVKQESETNIEARRTKDMLEDMVYRGEAMKCPTCQVILMKKWGCDWLRCSMCKTEICWVTRGSRWGPGGKGDTTGGCQCGLLGIKCHPRCNYCH